MATTGGHLVYSEKRGKKIRVGSKAKKLLVMAENERMGPQTEQCPECGKEFKDLKRHMERMHG